MSIEGIETIEAADLTATSEWPPKIPDWMEYVDQSSPVSLPETWEAPQLPELSFDTLDRSVPHGDLPFVGVAASGTCVCPSFYAVGSEVGPRPTLIARSTYSMVYDHQGLENRSCIPIFIAHQSRYLAGVVLSVTPTHGRLAVNGMIFGDMDPGRHVVQTYNNGMCWGLSTGIPVSDSGVEFISKGAVEVNGRLFMAPVIVCRRWRLDEVSLVDRPADRDTCFLLDPLALGPIPRPVKANSDSD